ncbi:polygalacturonase-like [Zingiber officinale]|uniref:polygalacturonase-like n=1 Tax=Zingiber officinale TaxID=94328 RepID=UPI001C4B79D5|nr:polygalacturonase-like [Zingiber officinale]
MAELKVITIVLLLALVLCSRPVEAVFNIADYGAKSDGQTDSAGALLSAWQAACRSTGAATVYVPAGSFLVRRGEFSGPCESSKITFQIDGTLVAPSGYGTAGEWLLFDHVEGVEVYGGTIDGRGSSLWACKAGSHGCPAGVSSLVFRNSKGITVSGLTSVNSELYHMVIDNCEGVTMQGVRITAPGSSPNTDGIHVQGSSHVTITGAGIKTGDDCISIGPGTTDLWIEQVNCGPGHGISIGSLGKGYDEAGVENVTVKTSVFAGTTNGLRIKTWGRPSEGFVRGVVFEHSVMQDVQNPIIIDQNYCPDDKGCPDQSSGVKISEVTYNDIHGSSASQVAVKFECSPSNPCTGIWLQDIKLTYGNTPAESSCEHADGSASGFVVPPSCL